VFYLGGVILHLGKYGNSSVFYIFQKASRVLFLSGLHYGSNLSQKFSWFLPKQMAYYYYEMSSDQFSKSLNS
jgi:hypothetical protein